MFLVIKANRSQGAARTSVYRRSKLEITDNILISIEADENHEPDSTERDECRESISDGKSRAFCQAVVSCELGYCFRTMKTEAMRF